jgi:hypothetical protein
MLKNMGSADRVIRIIAATVFFYLYFTGTVSGVIGIILLVFGIVFVVTSLIGNCPLYRIFGMNTAKGKK